MKKPVLLEPLLDIETIIPILNKISIFGALSDKQLFRVFALLKKTEYDQGEFVFERGDFPSHIYIVLSGRVELVLDTGSGYLAQAVFEEGQCFGEAAVIGVQNHTASAIAIEDTTLIVLSREALFKIWEEDKELFGIIILNIAREACRRLNHADETMLYYFARHKS